MQNSDVIALENINSEITFRLNEQEIEKDLRGYNGLSSIGEKCLRKLQLGHYNCYTTKNTIRILRLFNEGHRMEPVLVDLLNQELGIEHYDDQRQVVGFSGHWKGHIDGVGVFNYQSPLAEAYDDEFLTEFKTHNDKSFKDLLKNGVIKSKPGHYAQMTAYMGYLGLKKALYIAYNKNDSEIYHEWIDFDPEYFKELQRKEAEVVMAESLIERVGTNKPSWFECKMCDAKDVCFGKKEINKSCKNCKWVDVLDGGKWECRHLVTELSEFRPCDEYELGEMFCQLN